MCSLFQSNVYRLGATPNDKKGKKKKNTKFKTTEKVTIYIYISELKLRKSRRDYYSHYFGTIRMDLKKVPSMGSTT